ncbi:MAG: FecR domain-containing protein [Sterolibacterium sp.]|nr:FecR domain-containing protein [Sterolibacterium sp.]
MTNTLHPDHRPPVTARARLFLLALPLLVGSGILPLHATATPLEANTSTNTNTSTTASIGEVTLSIGSSEIHREGRAQSVGKGSPILAGDIIRTSASGHVHVRFVDGALLSVRPQSVLHVQEYRYNPARPTDSLVKFYLETGIVREISGHAAQMAKERFRLNTPLAAIGVRGTDFITQVTEQSTAVLVNQGAIVLTPLDAACSASTFGPCQTERSRELADHMGGTALIYRQATPEPVLQPVTTLKGIERVAPILQPQSSNDNNVTNVVNDSRNPETLLDLIKPANSLVWGRWARDPRPGDHLSVAFAEALQGNRVTVGDGYYFLFRNENIPNLLPAASGQAQFKLQDSSAHYRAVSNEISAAKVEKGSLGIDFNHNTFNTQLTVSYPGTSGTQQETLTASGTLDRHTGIFLGNPADKTTRIAGALAQDIRQAGYLFNKTLGNAAISGATLWNR